MIPDYQSLMLPVLKAAANKIISIEDILPKIAEEMHLSKQELIIKTSTGINLLKNRIAWAKSYMVQAGLLKIVSRGKFTVTEEGLRLLSMNPKFINNKVLERYESFNAFKKKTTQSKEQKYKINQKNVQEQTKEIKSFLEKKKRKENHIQYEGRLNTKDIKYIKEHFGYICMGCGLNPITEYGEKMKTILEAHHKNPYSEILEGETRTIDYNDFFILCPNCHAIIHKLKSLDDLDKLQKLVHKKNS